MVIEKNKWNSLPDNIYLSQQVVLDGQASDPVPVLSGAPGVSFRTDPVPYFYK